MDRNVHFDPKQDLIVFWLQGETSEWVEAAVTGQALTDAYGCGASQDERLRAFAEHEQRIRDRAEQLLDEGLEPLVKSEDLAPHGQHGKGKETVKAIGQDGEGETG